MRSPHARPSEHWWAPRPWSPGHCDYQWRSMRICVAGISPGTQQLATLGIQKHDTFKKQVVCHSEIDLSFEKKFMQCTSDNCQWLSRTVRLSQVVPKRNVLSLCQHREFSGATVSFVSHEQLEGLSDCWQRIQCFGGAWGGHAFGMKFD